MENSKLSLQKKADGFLKNKQKVDLMYIVNDLKRNLNDNKPVSSTVLALENIFVEILKGGKYKNASQFMNDTNLTTSEYSIWLKERYEESLKLMLITMESSRVPDRIQALLSSMNLLRVEGENSIIKGVPNEIPTARLKFIIENLLSNKFSQKSVIERFREYGKLLDVSYYTWDLLRKGLLHRNVVKNEISFANLMYLINSIGVTKEFTNKEKCLVHSNTKYPYVRIRKYINTTWNIIMQSIRSNISDKMLKHVLITLLECILPHLEKPISLTDFLMDSLNRKGAASLLALQGVYILIQKCNITYPNIYEKLYCLLESDVLHTKYKTRLFYLTDVFLSSTHLPKNLVAAFIKRLARLSLIAGPHDIIVMLNFIQQLILRHPDLKKLLYADAPTELKGDPYDMNERDPTRSNAINSSLWEVILLQKHAIPTVANKAKNICESCDKCDNNDLSTILESNETDIFKEEINGKIERYTLAFERPLNIFLPTNDRITAYWSLIT